MLARELIAKRRPDGSGRSDHRWIFQNSHRLGFSPNILPKPCVATFGSGMSGEPKNIHFAFPLSPLYAFLNANGTTIRGFAAVC